MDLRIFLTEKPRRPGQGRLTLDISVGYRTLNARVPWNSVSLSHPCS
ncbi:hypothetical protein [Rhodobacteraceae phage LS06-2018-MD06]|nr:hypothetical protein [Rhodobacteraceae phage LS06-2018-MD06]